VRPKTQRVGAVELRKDGPWVVLHSAALTAPEPALQALLAHEMAHIARGHPALRRRLRIASVAAIWLVAFSFIAFASVQVAIGNPWQWWVWLATATIWLAAMLAPRAAQLAIYRRQEYEADRITVEWLGSSGPMIALFDWLSTNAQPLSRRLPARLWLARQPSTAARRQALARLGTSEGHSSSGR